MNLFGWGWACYVALCYGRLYKLGDDQLLKLHPIVVVSLLESNAAFRAMVILGDNKKWPKLLLHSEPATVSKRSSLLYSKPIVYIYGCGQILSLMKSLWRDFPSILFE